MFTQTEKIKILRYMGWTHFTLETGSRWYSKFIDEQLGIDNATVLEEVRILLNQCISIDSQLNSSTNRLKVTSLGQNEINLNRDEISQLRAERFRLVSEIADLLRIPFPKGGY